MTSTEGAHAAIAALASPPVTNSTIAFEPPPTIPLPKPQSVTYTPIVVNPFANTHGDP